jgi:spermidine synthase
MGISFTMLQCAVHDDRQTTGHKVGILQAGNIVGNVTGSLLVGLVLLGSIGTAGTLRAVLLVGAVFPLLWVWLGRSRGRFVAATVLLLTIVALLPRSERLWMRLHGLDHGPAVIAEDAMGVVAVAPEPAIEDEWRMSVNGEQHSWFPFGGVHSKLGAIGMILHPAPAEIAIIGLGSGDTAWAAGLRPETQTIVVFELCSAQLGVLDQLAIKKLTPQLPSFHSDARYRHITADGRNALASSDRHFDMIESDALRPYSASSGNLYSRELFRMCAERLRPGGIICQWGATPRVRTTFAEALPYVLRLRNGEILVGSNDPIEVKLPTWRARLYSRESLDYLGQELVDELWADLQTASAAPLPKGLIKPNLDLFPRDELRVPIW